MSFNYPKLLEPISFEIFHIDSREVRINKVEISFKKWEGVSPTYTFGGKPIIDHEGLPMFAEVAIMNLLAKSGWNTRWIETYGASKTNPFHFSKWINGKLSDQEHDPIKDERILSILNGIAQLNNGSYSGCWDVFGWRNDQILFLESKRSKKDKIRLTQIKWLASALQYGLTIENFLFVEWSF